MNCRSTSSLLLALLTLGSCARAPRAPDKARQIENPRTRANQQAAPLKAQPTPSATSDSAGCTVALQLSDGLADCTFERCPSHLLERLLTEEKLLMERGADGQLGILAQRPEPPRTVRLATFTRIGKKWEALAETDRLTGRCKGIPEAGVEGSIKGVSVRRTLVGDLIRRRL